MATECRICGERIFTPHPKNIFEKRNHRIRTAIEQITGLEVASLRLGVSNYYSPSQHFCRLFWRSCCLSTYAHAVY